MDKVHEAILTYSKSVNDSNISHFIDLPNDAAKLEYAIRFLCDNDELLSIYPEPKSAEKANEIIEKANVHFATTTWQSLLDIYTEAAMYAPHDSNELARAYGNRSAALYNGRLYKKALLDIERALDIGYPDNTKSKLYTRKARCLLALDKKMSSKAREALTEARKYLPKMDDADKLYIRKVLNKLSTNISMEEPFPELDCDKFRPITPESNPKIKRASAAMELKYSEKLGRHITATRDIGAGEILLVHKAYASIIDPNFLRKYCWHCSRRAWAGVPCRECVAVIFCSDTCRDMAWQDYHDIECLVIPAVLQQNMTDLDLMVLKLTVKAYKEAGTVENLKEELIRIDSIKDPIARMYSDNVFDDEKYVSIYTSPKGPSLALAGSIRCAMTLYCLLSTTEILGERITNIRSLLNNELASFIGTLMMAHYSMCDVNNVSINFRDDYDVIMRYGAAMYPFLNLYNHSCDPNARKFAIRDTSIVVAVQKIKRGEQICLSYGPLFLDQAADSRKEYLELFHFECDCKACAENWGPESFSSFPSYKWNRLPAELQLLLRRIPQDCPNIYECIIEAADIPIVITSILKNMHLLQRAMKYPTQEILTLKQALLTLYSSISLVANV